MSNYLIVLKALFKNKFRFADNASKGKKYGFTILLAVVYVAVMAILISGLVQLQSFAEIPEIKLMLYLFGLMTAALIVLIFGVVNLVSTLYLSKDTDFFSMLPVKSSVVYAAKVSFVYLSEAIIVCAILLPLIITFGIVSHAWVWFYIISIVALIIMPCLPLVIAAIVAVPVMFFASKLKNRSVVSLIFYLVLFGGFFGVYIYFIYASTDISGITEDSLIEFTKGLEAILYVFYPYTALAMAACAIPSYGLALGASTAANVAIFFGASLAMLAIVLLLAKFMYSQSAKANNQTYNAKVKRGEFKRSGMIKALMKREYTGTFRTTQIAFQCYAVVIMPTIIAIVLGIVGINVDKIFAAETSDPEELAMMSYFFRQLFSLIGISTITMMLATVANGAATTFSREGTDIAALKVLPCSAKQIVKAKTLAWIGVAVPATLVAVVLFNALNFDLTNFLLSLFSLVPLSAAYALFGALWDLTAPKLKWVDPIQAVKHNGHVVIGQFICMAGGILSFISIMILGNYVGDLNALRIVNWVIIYLTLAVFAVVDMIMLRNVEKYFDRIEI